MAVKTTQNLTFGDRMRVFIDGYSVGTCRSGLAMEPNIQTASAVVYGQADSIQTAKYISGDQSLEIIENDDMVTLNKVLAGFDPNVDASPIIARTDATIPKHVVVVETLNDTRDGYAGVSQMAANFRASFGAPRGNPDGELVRTVSGMADIPLEVLTGGQFMSARITLVSGGTGNTGSWSSPVPLEMLDIGSGIYAAYLEVQKAGTTRTFKSAQLTVDTTNVTASGSGGQVLIPHADVITANLGGNATHAWVVFLHNQSALQTHAGRYS
jgi:hypothetical protein